MKNLVYICYILVGGFVLYWVMPLKGLFEALNQISFYIAKRKQRTETVSGSKATYKKFSDFVQNGSKRALW